MKLLAIIPFLLFSTSLMSEEITHKRGSHYSIWGKREFSFYSPKKPKAIIVALHGCMQEGEAFVEGSRLLEMAKVYNYALLVPAQDNISNKYNCWNWFFPFNQMRSGEPASIVALLNHIRIEQELTHVPNFVIGMSAGGAMASILANVYPEVFSAVSSHHGVQYKATEYPLNAEDVTYNGASNPAIWAATKGYLLSGSVLTSTKMPAIIFYGSTQDEVMNPIHAEQIEREFLYLNDFLDNGILDNSTKSNQVVTTHTPDQKYSYKKITHYSRKKVLTERYMIDHLGHAWSGGNPDYAFNDEMGPDATLLTLKFFKNFGL